MKSRPGDRSSSLEQENEAAARREAEERLRERRSAARELAERPAPDGARGDPRAARAGARRASSSRERSLKRREQLVAQNFISKESLDEARSIHERDRRARRRAESAHLATARLAARQDEIKRRASGKVEAAQAALAQAEWRLEQKSFRRRSAGTVAGYAIREGRMGPAGAPVRVAAAAREHQSALLRARTAARRSTDRPDGERRRATVVRPRSAARVTFISPHAEFTPPVIYSRENRSKLVFLIEARPAPGDA